MRAFLIVTLLLVVPLAAVHGRTNALNVTFTLSKPFAELSFFAFGTLGVTQVRVGMSSPTSVVFALVKADRMTGDRVAAHIKTERAICNATDPPFETPRLSPASNTSTATITITDPGYYALIVYRCAAPGEAASVVVPIVVTQYNVAEPRTEPCTTSSSDEILSVLSLFVLAVHLGCTLLWLHFLRQRSERTPSDDLLLTSLTSIAVATCVNLEMRRIALYDRRRFSDALQSSYEATIEVTQAASTALMFTFVALTGLSRQLRLLLFALGTGQFIFHVASLCALNTEDTLSDTSRTLVDATCCMVTLLPVVSMMLHRHPAQTPASEEMEHPHVVAVVEASPQDLVETEGQVVVTAPTLVTLPPSGSQPALQRYMWLYTAIVLFFYAVGLLVAIEGHLAYTTAWVCQAFILFVTWCFHLYCAAAMGHQQQLVQPI